MTICSEGKLWFAENCTFLYIDTYNIFRGIFPNFDFINRKTFRFFKYYDIKSAKIIDKLRVKKKYKIYDSHTLFKVTKRIRNENPILKKYLNLYMNIYEYATITPSILNDIKTLVAIIKLVTKEQILKIDLQIFKQLKKNDIIKINKALAFCFYLFYHDALILQRKILAFNIRICGNRISTDFITDYRKTPLFTLSYSILRQQLRVYLLTVTMTSLLKFKKYLFYLIKWLQ